MMVGEGRAEYVEVAAPTPAPEPPPAPRLSPTERALAGSPRTEPDPNVYRLGSEPGPAIQDSEALRQRVAAFEHSYEVMAAQVFDDESLGIPCDVYMVFNDADGATEVHQILWYSEDGQQYTKFHKVTTVTLLTRSPTMLLLDLNNDGTREVISFFNGVNITHPLIIDFNRPSRDRIFLEGIESLHYGSPYEFEDLDGDGDFECIATASGERDLACFGERFEQAGVAYIVHEIQGDEYVRTSVSTQRPHKTW
jgi:hypothetical protein